MCLCVYTVDKKTIVKPERCLANIMGSSFKTLSETSNIGSIMTSKCVKQNACCQGARLNGFYWKLMCMTKTLRSEQHKNYFDLGFNFLKSDDIKTKPNKSIITVFLYYVQLSINDPTLKCMLFVVYFLKIQ